MSSPSPTVEALLRRLLRGHHNPLRLLRLHHLLPSPLSLRLALLSLSRARLFPSALLLLRNSPISSSLPAAPLLSLLLPHFAKFHPFPRTLHLFHHLSLSRPFALPEFNALLRSFCVNRRMPDARAAFRLLSPRFGADISTMNTLLLGFKDSGSLPATELFFHDLVLRGFRPNALTYNIRVDAYCKKGKLDDAVAIMDEMRIRGLPPTCETITTLVHGAGIVRDPARARELFETITEPDTCAYNALLCALMRVGRMGEAEDVMAEMETRGIMHDDGTWHAVLLGMMNHGGVEDVRGMFKRMMEREFVPVMRIAVMLMKYFCKEKRRLDLGMELWEYMVESGCCPHGHALDLLGTGLCEAGRVDEAYRCFKQVVRMGRYPSERGYRILEGSLLRSGSVEKLKEIEGMIRRLQEVMPPSKGHALYSSCSADITADMRMFWTPQSALPPLLSFPRAGGFFLKDHNRSQACARAPAAARTAFCMS